MRTWTEIPFIWERTTRSVRAASMQDFSLVEASTLFGLTEVPSTSNLKGDGFDAYWPEAAPRAKDALKMFFA